MSQSQDCEPTPPLPRHPSKTNFFSTDGGGPLAHGVPTAAYHHHHHHHGPVYQDSPARKTSHGQPQIQQQRAPRSPPHASRPRGLDSGMGRSRSTTPDPLSPERPLQTSPPGGIGGTRSPPIGGVYVGLPTPGSPTLHHRMKQLGGVPTPLAMSSPLRRSNPSTPTQPRRPDFIGIDGGGVRPGVPMVQYYPPQYSAYETGALPPHTHATASPQRRYMSESELLLRGGEAVGVGAGYPPRTTTMFDNIQELAGSPQHGQYTWRDTSPPHYCPKDVGVGAYCGPGTAPDYHHRSNPTSPTQTCPAPHYYPTMHHPPTSGIGVGVPSANMPPPHYQGGNTSSYQSHPVGPHVVHTSTGYPPHPQMIGRRNSGPSYVGGPQSPQIRRKNYGVGVGGMVTPPTPTEGSGRPSPAQKRPISFVRSLDVMDSIEMRAPPQSQHGDASHHLVRGGAPAGHHHMIGGNNLSPTHRGGPPPQTSAAQDLDRRSAYDMNYEISV